MEGGGTLVCASDGDEFECDVWRVARDILTCDIPREDGRSHYITGIPLISRLAIYLLITKLYIYY
jgi:hypothetical protein